MYELLAKRLIQVIKEGKSSYDLHETMDQVRGKYIVLRYLYIVQDGALISELQRAANVGSGRISDLINQLVKKKYVEKRKSVSDQRKTQIYLTKEGLRFILDATAKITHEMAHKLKNLTIEEATMFIDLLEKIVAT